MRSAVIILVCLAALVAGFAVFMLLEPAPPAVRHVERSSIAASLPAPPSATQKVEGPGVGAGQNVWIQTFDKKTGALLSEFKADKYDPPVDSQVHVVNANARFYEKNGQVMTLTAATGDMVMPEQAKKSDSMTSISAQPPSHGILYDVTLRLYDDIDSLEDHPEEPTLTCKMPILSFDNDTLSLATIPLHKGDLTVPADMIPVVVRGRDYDFDGTGLKVRYNQRDQHLEYLQVAHGQRLLIKHPKNINDGPTIGGPISTPATQPVVPAAMNGEHARATPVMLNGEPLELADVDKSIASQMSAEERARHRAKRLAATRAAAAAAATRAAASTQKSKEIVAYHATFDQNVKLKQGDAPLGDADRMVVTFTFEGGHASTQPAAAPAADRTEKTADKSAELVNQGPRPITAEPAATAPAHAHHAPRAAATESAAPTIAAVPSAMAAPATAAATEPDTDEQPIEVTWSGPLTVVPLKLGDSGLKTSGDHIVEFTGQPAHLYRDGNSVVSPYVWAGVEGDRFAAKGDKAFPTVTIKDVQGLTLQTQSIDSDGNIVNIHGNSVAVNTLPQSDANLPAQTMTTKWTDHAVLHIVTTAAGDKAIDHARLVGNVDVQHPQMHVTGDTLELGFLSSQRGQQPQISAVNIAGNVTAAMKNQDANGNSTVQTITSNKLDLATAQQADGSVAVKTIHANGDVKAVNNGQTLTSEDLVATLLPPSANSQPAATQVASMPSAAELDHMVASGNVHFTSPDGHTAACDILKIDRRAVQPDNGPAVQDISLLGTPAVVTDPTSKITGKLIKLDSTGQTASVVGAGTMDGVAKSSGGDGTQTPRPMNVTWTDSFDYDGAANHARVNGNVVITSKDNDGSIDHATGKSLDLVLVDNPNTTQSTTQTASNQPGDVFGGTGQSKLVKQMTLNDNVQVSSTLPDPNNPGQYLRRMNMFGPQLILTNGPDGSITSMTVPAAGRMLLEDNGKTAATEPADAGGMSAQGKTAVAWSKSLTYDTIIKKATLLGDVVVVHQANNGDSLRMAAPRMVADLDDSQPGQTQIKQVVAEDGATFTNDKIRFESDHATYQPQDDRVIASGTARQPVQVFDENGLSTGTFDEMWWNVKTNQPERLKNVSVQSRGLHVDQPSNKNQQQQPMNPLPQQ